MTLFPEEPKTFERLVNDRPITVREISCKTILHRSGLGDYALNCYVGCTHACGYCYARYMQRFHPHRESWGAFVDVKINAVEALRRQLRTARPGAVFVSSACDGWQPIENEFSLTRECCRILSEHGFEIHALTKSNLILRDFDVLMPERTRIAVTITSLDATLQQIWEPDAAPVSARLEIVKKAHAAGYKTGIMFGPILPFLFDTQEHVDRLMEAATSVGVNIIWVDAMNPRPKVWESVLTVLRKHFPDLVDRYRAVLFSEKIREAYCQALRQRFQRAAERLGYAERLVVCV